MSVVARFRATRGVLVVVAMALMLAGCQSHSENAESHASAHDGQRTAVASAAEHVAGARWAAVTGDQKGEQRNVDALSKGILRDAHIPDPSRPMPHEAARARIERISGVRSVVWIDHDNLLVLVDGPRLRTMAMVDSVCDVIAPLGDTLGVVVNVQDVTATTSAGADAVSRDCQLPAGQRAFLEGHRQIEALDPKIRSAFEAQQGQKGGRQ